MSRVSPPRDAAALHRAAERVLRIAAVALAASTVILGLVPVAQFAQAGALTKLAPWIVLGTTTLFQVAVFAFTAQLAVRSRWRSVLVLSVVAGVLNGAIDGGVIGLFGEGYAFALRFARNGSAGGLVYGAVYGVANVTLLRLLRPALLTPSETTLGRAKIAASLAVFVPVGALLAHGFSQLSLGSPFGIPTWFETLLGVLLVGPEILTNVDAAPFVTLPVTAFLVSGLALLVFTVQHRRRRRHATRGAR